MNTKPWIARLSTSIVVSVVLLIANSAIAQGGPRVLDYMLENRVSMETAANALGLSILDAAEELGYPRLDFYRAEKETVLLFAECWVFLPNWVDGVLASGPTLESISNYFALRMANDASFLPQCNPRDNSGRFIIFLQVWTVGNDFPIAYHLDFSGNFLPRIEGEEPDVVSDAWLGYSNASSIEDVIRNTIDEFVEEFAMTLLRVRSLR